MLRRLILTLTVIAIACAESGTDSGQQIADCMTVGYLDITASAPLFIAEAQGYFDSLGVCVQTEAFGTSNQLVDAMASNRINYVVETSAVPALALASRDSSRFVITAASTISVEEPFDAILTLRATGISSIAELAGKRIAVFPGTTATALLRRFLEESGIETSGIEFIPTAPGNQLPALLSGAVDALHAYEPTWTVALADTAVVEVHGTVYGRQLSPNPQGVSLMNRRTLEERPEAARNLVAAFDRALGMMRNDEAGTREILRSRFDLPGDAVERMRLLYMSPSDSIDWASIGRYADLLLTVGELDTVPSIEALRGQAR